jgi:hypothetical protein
VHKRGQIAPLTLSDVVSAGMCNICRHGARLELPLPGTMGVLMKLLKGLTQRPITGINSVLGRLMATSVVGGPRYGKATPRGGSFYPARAFSSDPRRKNLRSLAPHSRLPPGGDRDPSAARAGTGSRHRRLWPARDPTVGTPERSIKASLITPSNARPRECLGGISIAPCEHG